MKTITPTPSRGNVRSEDGPFIMRSYLLMTLPTLLSLLFIGSFGPSVMAQKKCLSHEIRDKQNAANPEIQRRRQILERQIKDYVDKNSNAREGAQVTIPVVFHVIHNGDAVGQNENLSDAQLMAQLAQLNADFSRTNTDAGNTPAGFQGVAANTMIQFCLATIDPMMNATTGIVRTNIASLPNNVTEAACWTSDYIQANIIDPLVWNTANYLNIFTVSMLRDLDNNNQCVDVGTLGYATFPGAPANEDVAVHLARTIGSVAMPNPAGGAVGLGRTVTHEVGHWLMLKHIWGDNGGCVDDDDVADTPIQNGSTMQCPNFPQFDACTGAGNGIMFMNFMDYVDDNCMNLFTQGQATRMMAAITNGRPGLLNSQCGMNPTNDGYTCANAIAINAAGTYTAPGPSQGNGAVATDIATHANWYRFTPPMTGMIRIFTCGLNNGGNNHNHIYLDATNCPTTANNVVHTADRGCAANPTDPAAGVLLENVPVTMGTPIYIEWDDALGNTAAFDWTLEYQTAGNTCTDYASVDVPKTIQDNTPSGVTSMVNVASGGVITDVNVKNLQGDHTYLGALIFTLQSPNGTTVTLINQSCTNGPNFNISLDDEAAQNPLPCPYNTGGTFRPAQVLSAFDGENPMGNWVLNVSDNDGEGDTGSLTGWTLEVCIQGGGGDCPPTRAVDAMPIASGTYQAANQLTSMGSVATGSNVTLRAGNNVELQQNFEVAGNANLEVRIEGCQ